MRARDAAAEGAGFAFVDAAALDAPERGQAGAPVGVVPALALVTQQAQQLLNDAGEGTLGT